MSKNGSSKGRRTNRRADREAFFVLVEAGGGVEFFNATEHVGKEMPFSKPQATCAMRAAGDVVAFSLLRLTKANSSTVAAKPIQLPRGPLSRLERRALQCADELADGQMVVEISTRLPFPAKEESTESTKPADVPAAGGLEDLFAPAPVPASAGLEDLFDGPAKPAEEDTAEKATPEKKEADSTKPKARPQRPHRVDTYRCSVRRDENNVAFIEETDEDTVIEVPRGAIHVSMYFKSPAVDRVLAMSFIGAIGKKPGTSETVARVAAMALNTASKLTEFRVLSAIESVSIPAGLGNGAAPVASRNSAEKAEFGIKLYMFSEELQPLQVGSVHAEIDLENANPASGRLLVKYTPEDSIAEMFPHYRTSVDNAVGAQLRQVLGDDQIADITYDVILGGVDTGTVERLREVGATMQELDVTPTNYRIHD